MSMHIILDGYNVIRQSRRLSRKDREDIQMGRDALMDRLAAYKKLRGHRMTVVFDGGNAPHFSRQRDRVKGIDVVYSRAGETADRVIQRMAGKHRETALVVSSDREVVDYAARQGCATVSSPEFEEKMEMALYMNEKGLMEPDGESGGWTPITRKKGPRRRLPKHQRRNKRKLRRL